MSPWKYRGTDFRPRSYSMMYHSVFFLYVTLEDAFHTVPYLLYKVIYHVVAWIFRCESIGGPPYSSPLLFYPPREPPSPVLKWAACQTCADIVCTHIFRIRFIRQNTDTDPSKRLAHIQTRLMSFNCTCSIGERMSMVTAIFNGRDRYNEISEMVTDNRLGGHKQKPGCKAGRARGNLSNYCAKPCIEF